MNEPCILLNRYAGNPIIEPVPGHTWECGQTFNPGAICLEGNVYLLYRAIGIDGISRFGFASSHDGYTIDDRLEYPVYEHPFVSPVLPLLPYGSGGSFGGAEDPRIVHVPGDDVLYVTYTVYGNGLGMSLTSISIDDFLSRNWRWSPPVPISPPDQVHKNWVIFPEKIDGRYAVLHNLNPEIMISYHETLNVPPGTYLNSYTERHTKNGSSSWDAYVRGAGAPPVRTEKGWLLFYHAMTKDDYGKYKVGALLLDLNDPKKILSHSSAPVLEPTEECENNGFKPGVVYLSGAVVRNGELLVYYGASDNYVCVAGCRLEKLLDILTENTGKTPPPEPSRRAVRRDTGKEG